MQKALGKKGCQDVSQVLIGVSLLGFLIGITAVFRASGFKVKTQFETGCQGVM
jgi:hypothetical protein